VETDPVSEDPRFTCRREGHRPALVIATASPSFQSYLAPCKVCGQVFEWTTDGRVIEAA
jgi:transcription elongation factor Elf1